LEAEEVRDERSRIECRLRILKLAHIARIHHSRRLGLAHIAFDIAEVASIVRPIENRVEPFLHNAAFTPQSHHGRPNCYRADGTAIYSCQPRRQERIDDSRQRFATCEK